LAGELGSAGGPVLCEMVADAVQRIAPVHPRVMPTLIADTPVLRGAVLASVEMARQALFSVTEP
jgi:hypothetical protein